MINDNSEHPSEVAIVKPKSHIHTPCGLMEFNEKTEEYVVVSFPKQQRLSYYQVRYLLPALQDTVSINRD